MHNVEYGNNLFLNAFQFAPSGIALVSLNGNWLKVNPSFCRMLGYEEEELLTKTFQVLTFPADLEMDLEYVKQMINKEIETYHVEKRYVHKQGHLIWTLLSVSLVYNEDGSPKYFISQILDITAIKQAQNQIMELTDRTNDILDSITDAFFTVDNHWNFVYVNQEAEQFFHKSLEGLMGKTVWEVFPILLGTVFERNFKHALVNKVKKKFVEFMPSKVHAPGRWFEINIYPTRDGLSTYFQDVTERKLTEEKLVKSEQWFRLLADYSTDMISRHSPEGLYLYVSPVCFNLLGYQPDELIGKAAYDFFHPDDVAIIRYSHFEVTSEPDIQTVSYRIRKKDGTYAWFETTSRSIFDTKEIITEIISVSRDITKRKTSEIQMNEANELLLKLSMTDGLTGIANRRAFDEALEREWKANARLGQPFTLLLCDLDFFKAFNDTYGHQAGDVCLQRVANALKAELNRPNDFVARYGGEEFAILLPNTNETAALQVSDRIRAQIQSLQIPHLTSELSEVDVVTLSIGLVTRIPTSLLSVHDLVDHADKALYQAKSNGRNCVAMYKQDI
jgi:diguanylate cyclase (GGDEF)-like protein/PAS domain S-box-containing protein